MLHFCSPGATCGCGATYIYLNANIVVEIFIVQMEVILLTG